MQGKAKLLVVHNGRMVSPDRARGAGPHPPGLPPPAARRGAGYRADGGGGAGYRAGGGMHGAGSQAGGGVWRG